MRSDLVLALFLVASPATAQTAASDSAKKFNLDPTVLQADDSVTVAPPVEGPPATVADETKEMEAVAAAPVTLPALADAPTGALTLDTPIAALLADAHGKAVLDRDLPGLSTDDNLDKFSAKSLREFQPLTGGQLTDAMLAKVEADLAGPSAPAKRVDRRRSER